MKIRINIYTNNAGFSLFEILITIVILSFVSLIITNSLKYISLKEDFDKSVRNIVMHLKETHLQSRNNGSVEWVQFNLYDKTYSTSLHNKKFKLPSNAQIDIMSAQEYSKNDKISIIYFYGELGASGGIIRLRTNKRNKNIEVHALTGFIKIQE